VCRDYPHDHRDRWDQRGKGTGILRVHVWPITARSTHAPDRRNGRPGFSNIVTADDFTVRASFVDGIYTNRRRAASLSCSFRVTEAAYCHRRGMDILAAEIGHDPAELRLTNFIRRSSPVTRILRRLVGITIFGDYTTAIAQDDESSNRPAGRQGAGGAAARRYHARRTVSHGRRQCRSAPRSSRGPSKNKNATFWESRCSILEISMNPTAQVSPVGSKSQGQGATKTPRAKIIVNRDRYPADDIMVEEGNTDYRALRARHLRFRARPGRGAPRSRWRAKKIKATRRR